MLVFTNLIEGIQTGIMVALLIMVIKILRTKRVFAYGIINR